jgi:hypothetical protein
MANYGDKIRDYIAKLASVANVDSKRAANTVEKVVIETMAAELKALSKAVAQLATKLGIGPPVTYGLVKSNDENCNPNADTN